MATSLVIRHRHLSNHVRLVNHVRANQILMAVLGRFADLAATFERDLYFVLLALIWDMGKTPADIFSTGALRKFEQGQILTALSQNKRDLPAPIVDEIKRHFRLDAKGHGANQTRRNDFAHFNLLRANRPINLTAAMSDARALMAHDRKQKNAVSASITTMLQREQIRPAWSMGADHRLRDARIGTQRITHLKSASISENLRDRRFLTLIAALFGEREVPFAADLSSLTREEIVRLADGLTGAKQNS